MFSPAWSTLARKLPACHFAPFSVKKNNLKILRNYSNLSSLLCWGNGSPVNSKRVRGGSSANSSWAMKFHRAFLVGSVGPEEVQQLHAACYSTWPQKSLEGSTATRDGQNCSEVMPSQLSAECYTCFKYSLYVQIKRTLWWCTRSVHRIIYRNVDYHTCHGLIQGVPTHLSAKVFASSCRSKVFNVTL